MDKAQTQEDLLYDRCQVLEQRAEDLYIEKDQLVKDLKNSNNEKK
jgi:hypothetical protein